MIYSLKEGGKPTCTDKRREPQFEKKLMKNEILRYFICTYKKSVQDLDEENYKTLLKEIKKN